MYYINDTTGAIRISNNPPSSPGWTAMTQTEIDAYLLDKAKEGKVNELKNDLLIWRDAGYVYTGSLPAAATFNLSERSALYAKSKNDSEDTTSPDRYKYFDITYTQRDFVDNAGFNGLAQKINDEEDRIMVLYNNYRRQIVACNSISGPETPILDDITISFIP